MAQFTEALETYFKTNDEESWSLMKFLSENFELIVDSPPTTDNWTGLSGTWTHRFLKIAKSQDSVAADELNAKVFFFHSHLRGRLLTGYTLSPEWNFILAQVVVKGTLCKVKKELDDTANVRSFWEKVILTRKQRSLKFNYDISSINLLNTAGEYHASAVERSYKQDPVTKVGLERKSQTAALGVLDEFETGNEKREDEVKDQKQKRPLELLDPDEDRCSVSSWEFDSTPPSWFPKAIKEYKSSTLDTSERAINWRIINVSDRDHLLTYLSEEEFIALHSKFASALDDWKILEPPAERCLQTLAKLNSNQLLSIGRIIQVEGVRGAVKQALGLVEGTMASEEHDDGDNDNCDTKAAPVDLLREKDCSHSDVRYVFDLLRYCCEMLDKGIPQRNNSERDVDIVIKEHIFSCLDSILDKHYGEVVSRASRDRRAIAIGASERAEGYHLDWLFTRHDLAKDLAWGREFSLCERARSALETSKKLLSDTLRVQKTLRDMHRSLYDAVTDAGNGRLSKSVLNQVTKLLMPGFISSYFFVRVVLVIYIGGGLYASVDLAEFDIPTTTKEVENILKAARIMLQVKKILRSTIVQFKRLKERADQDKFGSEQIFAPSRQPESISPKKKRVASCEGARS